MIPMVTHAFIGADGAGWFVWFIDPDDGYPVGAFWIEQ